MYRAIIGVIGNAELPRSETVYRLTGYRNGDTNVSFFLSDTPRASDR